MHICEKNSSFLCRITYCKYGKNMLLYKHKIFVYKNIEKEKENVYYGQQDEFFP